MAFSVGSERAAESELAIHDDRPDTEQPLEELAGGNEERR
jgi:hypothetical protein